MRLTPMSRRVLSHLKAAVTAPVTVALIVVALAAPHDAKADPPKESPWLVEAAAYRLTLFMGNLKPVPWDRLDTAWVEPYHGAEVSEGPAAKLARASDLSAADVRAAIAAHDRQAMFAAATRLIAGRIEEELDRAVAAPGPAAAGAAAAEAQGLYRAIEDHLKAADAAAARRIGLAFLDLVSGAGTAGVVGVGARAPDRDRIGAARDEIAAYLDVNYRPAVFTPRKALTAIPETMAASGAAVDLPVRLPPGSEIRNQDPLPRLVLNFEEQGIDEKDRPLVAYGDMLFDSAQIFGDPARALGVSCATCHNRSDVNQRLFIPGASHQPGAVDVDGAFFNPMFNDYRDDPIDIPSMRGVRFTGPYGRDGRFASLREFTRNVIVNEFAGPEPTPFMLDAIVAYMTEFDFLENSKLTGEGALTDKASDAARRGAEIFRRPFAGLGDRSCASCHDPSSNFLDRRAHDIGSGGASYPGARDGAFDTPTLLGARFTAPYFHDGALPTLAAVVDWFDATKGLGLTVDERADLTAYVEAVGDADQPYQKFEGENTSFRLSFDEMTTFASTLDTLLPRRDKRHILILTNTLSFEFKRDVTAIANHDAKPEIYRLTDYISEIGRAVRADDWTAAEVAWSGFKGLAAEVDARAY